MATVAARRVAGGDNRFFLTTALMMAVIVIIAFSFQFAMGRSTFGAPALVHAHAIVFMAWVGLYVAQAATAASGGRALHRTLGWIASGWVVLMVLLGTAATVAMVRRGQAPFFFPPAQFLIFNPLSVLTFAGLTGAAVAMRRRTDWHRRLHYCGMSMLLGPAFGRLLPMPFLPPFAFEATFMAVLVFPLLGVLYDLRRTGRVHPAWTWGIGAMLVFMAAVDALTYSGPAESIYARIVAGTPGETVGALAYPPPPTGPLITGR